MDSIERTLEQFRREQWELWQKTVLPFPPGMQLHAPQAEQPSMVLPFHVDTTGEQSGAGSTRAPVSQLIVEEKERLGSEDAFWTKFTNPETGKRRLYQWIVDDVRASQVARDRQDAKDALRFFGGNLASDPQGRFSYSKGSGTRVCEKEFKIASIWHEILGTDPSVAAKWREMEGDGDGDAEMRVEGEIEG